VARDEAHLRRRKQRQERAAEHRARTERARVAQGQAVLAAAVARNRVEAPSAVKEALRAQIERFKARFGRVPAPGEPLFFAAGDGPEPVALDLGDTEGLVATSQAIGLPMPILESLVRSGLLVRKVEAGASP
jgi:hypothetical protein